MKQSLILKVLISNRISLFIDVIKFNKTKRNTISQNGFPFNVIDLRSGIVFKLRIIHLRIHAAFFHEFIMISLFHNATIIGLEGRFGISNREKLVNDHKGCFILHESLHIKYDSSLCQVR